HRSMLRRLLEYEVPEIYNGQVEIKNIAREAGYRSKVAVAALQEGIDPVGACVGMRGIRIQNIVKELHEEKIDVIEWNPNQEIFIAKALSPARVSGVYLEDDPDAGRTAVVIVPDDQLSLAIGREGQNARLAAKLTGWRIDIKSVTEAVQEALDNLDSPALRELQTAQAEMIENVQRIIEKRAANRAVMPEEFNALARFADVVQRRLISARDVARQTRLKEIESVRQTLPQGAFTLPLTALGLPENVTEALQQFENVGEIMLRFLIDENRVRRALSDFQPDTFRHLQEALDKLVIPEIDAPAVVEVSEDVLEDEVPVIIPGETPEDALLRQAAAEEVRRKKLPEAAVAPVFEEEEGDVDALDKKGKGKKNKGRQLVFDEKRGGMVVKRQRKGGRGDWNNWEE
ncbi:MAG: hypothetical protein ABI835_01695, partial [Chloroflexota bacterium]